MNEHLFDGINGLAGHSDAIDSLFRFLANDGIYVLAGLLAVLGLIELRRDRRFAVFVAASAVVTLIITGGLIVIAGHLVVEQRPFVADRDTVLLIKHAADNGFPSDHASVSAAIAVVGMLAWHRWIPFLAFLLFITGLARVVAGVHLPGDILAGWAGGAIAALLSWRTLQLVLVRLNKPIQSRQPASP
ncbi:MAG: phosphatase PAP2 family protein [Dehalococcoidia bacterium]|nr:phosphatase PAP2 family protein [Dehalococcoidia bacterium]